MADYPNVPVAPGVPPVARNGDNTPTPPPPLTEDGSIDSTSISGPQWGIFNSDLTPAIIGDAVISVELMKESRISTYPVEAPSLTSGSAGFASYNKVQFPFTSRISISQGGTDFERQSFMNTVDGAYQSLTLYSVATPELVYENANVVHYSFDRSAPQANMIVADIWLEEVRTTASSTLTTTVNPLSAAQTDTGAVQPQSPTTAQAQSQAMQGK